jgi:hypothetical protein
MRQPYAAQACCTNVAWARQHAKSTLTPLHMCTPIMLASSRLPTTPLACADAPSRRDGTAQMPTRTLRATSRLLYKYRIDSAGPRWIWAGPARKLTRDCDREVGSPAQVAEVSRTSTAMPSNTTMRWLTSLTDAPPFSAGRWFGLRRMLRSLGIGNRSSLKARWRRKDRRAMLHPFVIPEVHHRRRRGERDVAHAGLGDPPVAPWASYEAKLLLPDTERTSPRCSLRCGWRGD